MNTCRFCNIDNFKTRTIKAFKHSRVIFSNPHYMPCHLLIIPKRHVEKISELNDEERKELMVVIAEYTDKILKIFPAYSIHHNYMPMLEDSQTKVNHLHVHIWPRSKNDELYEKSMKHQDLLFTSLTEEEIEKYSELLK